MQDLDNALKGIARSLSEFVAPAVDSADPLARQQLKLAVAQLQFIRERLNLQGDRERFDVWHYLRLAEELGPGVERMQRPELTELLRTAGAFARQVAERVDARPSELEEASQTLAAVISVITRESASADPDVRARIEKTVVASSARWVEVERSWYLPLGFDPAPSEIPTLEKLLEPAFDGSAPARAR